MSKKCPITFGPLSKMLLIPFFFALNQIIYNIFILFYPGIPNQILETYSSSIGHMLNIIIPHIKFFSTETNKLKTLQTKEYKKSSSKRWILHYLLLIFINSLEIILLLLPGFLQQDSSETESSLASKLPFMAGAFSIESLIVILITIISFFLLKYRYYIHNNISLVSFIIMGIIIDLILENLHKEFLGKDILIIIINCAEIITTTINLCYQKYMIDILYHNYYNIVFSLGLNLFILTTLAIPYFILNEDLKEVFLNSYNDIGILISRLLVNMVIQFFLFLLKILTLAYFTPNHLLICLNLSKFVISLITRESLLKYLCIIPFAFQFFSLMVYLEIIELNFCGLNKNVKRNIQKRGDEDMLLKNISRTSSIQEIVEFPGGYVMSQSNQNAKEIEQEDITSSNSSTLNKSMQN